MSQANNKSDLTRSSSTSKSMRNMAINPGVQAKLMAFQAKRHQQMQQMKNNSDVSIDSQSNNNSNTELNLSVDNELSSESETAAISPLTSKIISSNNINNSAISNFNLNNSPSTPRSLTSSTFSSPMLSPNDERKTSDDDSLSRRTSFRLNNNNNNNNNNTNVDDSIIRRTSFRLNKTTSISSGNTISDDSDESLVNNVDFKRNLSNGKSYHSSIYPITKNINHLSQLQKINSSNSTISDTYSNNTQSNDPSTNDLNLNFNSSNILNDGKFHSDSIIQPHFSLSSNNNNNTNNSNSNNSNNNNNNNTSVDQTKPIPKQKLSLSQRRGLKLNFDSFNNAFSENDSTDNSSNKPESKNNSNDDNSNNKVNNTNNSNKNNEGNNNNNNNSNNNNNNNKNNNRNDNTNSNDMNLQNLKNRMNNLTLNSTLLNNRFNMNKLRDNALPNRGNKSTPVLKNSMSLDMGNNSSASKSKENSFTPFAKYIDVKSGSLNFSGKASLHSKGIDFSNGSSFRISMDDLDILDELGHGNYGVVSKVLHKPTGIIMAMKEVRLELDDSKFRQILMELEVLHSCNSDCIVEFYGAFFVEGAVYMCMEYMKGGSLDKVYGDGIPEIPLAYITKRVVSGLKTLKDEKNIIHRDVKPTNMLVNESGKVKLCDFGVSGNLVASLARTNIGCQSYMAPERIKHTNPDVSTYSVQSDIWSLGLSILEISKGCYPYPPETYNNVFSQLSAIVDGEPPELPAGKFSNEAHDFVAQCLHKNPKKRPNYSQLLLHPWLQKYDDNKGQTLLKEIVDRSIEKREVNKDPKLSSKSLPALHNGLHMYN